MKGFILMVGVATLVQQAQATFLHGIAIWGAQPDLVLVVLTFAAHRIGVQRGQIAGFIVGLVQDATSLSPFGFHAVVRMVPAALSGLLRGAMVVDAFAVPLLLTGIAQTAKIAMLALMGFISRHAYAQLWSTHLLIESVYTLACAPLVFFLLQRLFHLVGVHERRVSR